MTTLFISDLHLCDERPAITNLFLEFIQERAALADALYVLGDWFEYWIGDEAVTHDEYRFIVTAIRKITDNGTPVFVIRGNRDFLLGNQFEEHTGCRLLPEPSVIDLYGERVLVMHGDSLCIDDHEYQAFRQRVRSEDWKRNYLAKTVEERYTIFQDFRERSKVAKTRKKLEIMDVNGHAVNEIMRTHQVHDLIHGHTHRPGEHIFDLDGKRARRMVLGDWYENGSVLTCDANGWVLETLPLHISN
jgi:UDP-2,3-diacylglucosamine hydrolase